jgi:hypothetical protein
MTDFDDLTPLEIAFRQLMADPVRRRRWFAQTLRRWKQSPEGIQAMERYLESDYSGKRRFVRKTKGE